MTKEHLLSILDQHEKDLEDFGPATRADMSRRLLFQANQSEPTGHVLWMLEEMRKMAEYANFPAADVQEKIGRWLGFVQGVLWSFGWYSIDEMRDLNRPK